MEKKIVTNYENARKCEGKCALIHIGVKKNNIKETLHLHQF